ncbi:MAG: DUF4870 domain-containing protein [Planctomycetaceae bacterium]|nr:DUF4870 domain-containing protein [Planctomycetaceae bacterium]
MPQDNNDLFGMDANTYCMLMHLSQLLLFVIPVFGIVTPVVLWQINKDRNKQVDMHGRAIANWLLSVLIYYLAGGLLITVVAGITALVFAVFMTEFLFIAAIKLIIVIAAIFTFIMLLAFVVLFPVIGAIKARDGILWKYPLMIQFFR